MCRLFMVLTVGIGFIYTGWAGADTIDLIPLIAQAETQDDWNTWDISTPPSFSTSRFSWVLWERRGILEFSLTGIPSSSTIQSATLSFTIDTYQTPPDPVIAFHGYPANGLLESADAIQPFNPIGQETISGLGDYQTSLDSAYIESLLGSSSHLGLLTYQVQDGTQASLLSSSAVLQVHYVSEPTTLSLLALALALGALAVLKRKRTSWASRRDKVDAVAG